MPDRTHEDNALWVICCCGCLPVIGIIKGVLNCGVCAVMAAIPTLVISLLATPHNIFLCYWTLFKAQQLGPNITGLLMLISIIPLLLWPLAATVGAFIAGLLWGFISCVGGTFGGETFVLTDGFYESWKEVCTQVGKLYKWQRTELAEEMLLYRTNPNHDPTWDISFGLALASLAVGVLCTVMVTPLVALSATIYLLPLIVRALYEWFKVYWRDICTKSFTCGDFIWWAMAFPFWLAILLVVPVVVVSAYLLVLVIAPIAACLVSSSETYSVGARTAIALVLRISAEFEGALHAMLFSGDETKGGFLLSCLLGCKFDVATAATPPVPAPTNMV